MITLYKDTTGCKLPINLWTRWPEAMEDAGWQDVYQQFRNLANHPLARQHICGMPDYHLGYGMPIGGVLATQGGVVPNAVGVDIGCGMIAYRTDIEADSLSLDDLELLRVGIHRRVPVGFNRHVMSRAWKLPPAPAGSVVAKHYDTATHQVGTLGSGNHFIELQRDPDGMLWIMIHSGSRNIGKQVCDHYNGIAKEQTPWQVHDDLAYLASYLPAYHAYMAEMHWCMKFAEINRQAMMQEVLNALGALTGRLASGINIDLVVETHHNFVAEEEHNGEKLMIHRKGAVKAEGLVTIPGSMSTASYIGEGLASPYSFATCSHGAGRRMSRGQAKRTITHERAVESMGSVVYPVKKGQYDEMRDAYKDIEDVMAAQDDLVRPLWRLEPLTVVKG